MTLIVAPTEPAALKRLGRVSMLPERYGVDVLWVAGSGEGSEGDHAEPALCGVQRKEIKDLLASVADGRLGKELAQMQALEFRALVVEGRPQWTDEGVMVKSYGQPWTRAQWTGLWLSIQARGCWVVESRDVADTVQVVNECVKWSEKSVHKSLTAREKATASWGSTPDDRDFAVHVLQGFPGIGVELAGRIFDQFGKLPLGLTVSEDELRQVPGFGPKKMAAIRKVLG